MDNASTIDDLERVDACGLCGGQAFERVRSCREEHNPAWIHEMRGDRTFPVVRCARCGLAFVTPRYGRDKLTRLYGSAYFLGSDPLTAALRARYWSRRERLAALAGEADMLRDLLPGGRVLDVGCGPGWFADALGPGYEVDGLDISETATALAQERSRCRRALRADIETAAPAHGEYDAAAVIQTLDHLRSPLAALRNVSLALKPGGVLLLSKLPNLDAPMSRLFGDGFRLLAPNHLHCFTPETIRRMLAEAGLETIRIAYPFFSTGAFTPKWIVQAPTAVLRRLLGHRVPSPPAPGNMMTVLARKPAQETA